MTIVNLEDKRKEFDGREIAEKAHIDAQKLIKFFTELTWQLNFMSIEDYDVRLQYYNHIINQVVLPMREQLIKIFMSDLPYYRMIASNIMTHIKENDDFLCWVNMFGWTYNPIHTSAKETPMILFPFQYQFWKITRKYPKTIIIKSRTMGYTWVKAFMKVFRCLYDEDYKSLITSRVEDDIDITKDRHQTIMGRIRFILERLPYHVEYEDKKLHIIIGENAIMGASSSSDALRSKRATEVDVEEAGAIEDFTSLMASATSVANELRLGGTVKGTENGFYEYWENKDSAFYHIFWGFSEHPLFNCDDWVNKIKATYNGNDKVFRQEILGDFFAMIGNHVLVNLNKHLNEELSSKIIYSEFKGIKYKKFIAADPGLGDSLFALWFYYYNIETGEYFIVDYAEESGKFAKDIAAIIKEKGFGDAVLIIDAYANSKNSSGSSWAMDFMKNGIKVFLADNTEINATVIAANNNLNEGRIIFDMNKRSVEYGFTRLSRYTFTDQYGSTKIKKNKDADAGDAFRYMQLTPFVMLENQVFSKAILKEVDTLKRGSRYVNSLKFIKEAKVG